MRLKEFCDKALNAWGLPFILDMLIEECSETIQAIQHYKRRQEGSFTKLMEEVADTELIITNFKASLGMQIHEYNGIKRKKLLRAIKRLATTSTKVKG